MFKRDRALDLMRSQGRKRGWLAEQLDVSSDTITRYLKGDVEPPKATAIALATIMGVDLHELWADTAEQTTKRTA